MSELEPMAPEDRLIEVDLEEVLGGESPPDLVARTMERASVQPDVTARQTRRLAPGQGSSQGGPPTGLFILGFFLLAGFMLLAYPWLMRPPSVFSPEPPAPVSPPVGEAPDETDTRPGPAATQPAEGPASQEEPGDELITVKRGIIEVLRRTSAVTYPRRKESVRQDDRALEKLAQRLETVLRENEMLEIAMSEPVSPS